MWVAGVELLTYWHRSWVTDLPTSLWLFGAKFLGDWLTDFCVTCWSWVIDLPTPVWLVGDGWLTYQLLGDLLEMGYWLTNSWVTCWRWVTELPTSVWLVGDGWLTYWLLCDLLEMGDWLTNSCVTCRRWVTDLPTPGWPALYSSAHWWRVCGLPLTPFLYHILTRERRDAISFSLFHYNDEKYKYCSGKPLEHIHFTNN